MRVGEASGDDIDHATALRRELQVRIEPFMIVIDGQFGAIGPDHAQQRIAQRIAGFCVARKRDAVNLATASRQAVPIRVARRFDRAMYGVARRHARARAVIVCDIVRRHRRHLGAQTIWAGRFGIVAAGFDEYVAGFARRVEQRRVQRLIGVVIERDLVASGVVHGQHRIDRSFAFARRGVEREAIALALLDVQSEPVSVASRVNRAVRILPRLQLRCGAGVAAWIGLLRGCARRADSDGGQCGANE